MITYGSNVIIELLGLEDGLVEGVPAWALIYYCLRCGDLTAAIQSATLAGDGFAEMSKLLSEMNGQPDKKLTPHSENLVKLSYRRAIRSTTDPFKRAVYCLLGKRFLSRIKHCFKMVNNKASSTR